MRFTGHPILDVGIATIVAFANKASPEELVEEDYEAIADYMSQNYTTPALTSYLSIAFTINTGFTQPSFRKTPEKYQIFGEKVLRAFRSESPRLDEPGVFLGLPAANVSFDANDKLPPGRVFRQHIPMQTGEGIINFHPSGEAGLPISGEAILAFQAYPLGSAKCAGRTLSVHSDNPEIMLHFARQFLETNRRAISLAQVNNSKMSEPHLKYRTLLISTLLEARQMQRDSIDDTEPFSITAYHMTNSGQGADLAIYHLPSEVVGYLQAMYGAAYRSAWERIVRQGWALPKLRRGQKEAPTDFEPDRNWLYEDLFRLAANVQKEAPRFIRTYFLREPLRYAKGDVTDPRSTYSTKRQSNLITWKVTEPFLGRIMHMDAGRIEKIRTLGDNLADYVETENDKRFFRNFYVENRYGNFRNTLLKANTNYVKRGHAPFLTFDVFVAIFEDGEDLARLDWRLARDLVFIRMVEQLHSSGWLGTNQDALPEKDEDESQ